MLNVKEHPKAGDNQHLPVSANAPEKGASEGGQDTHAAGATLLQQETGKAQNATLSTLVDASAAREHLKALDASGVTFKRVAELTGVSSSTLARIVYGRPTEGIAPQREISAVNSALILGLEIDRQLVAAPENMTDVTGTIRRIQALSTLGFTDRIIYETSGISFDVFNAIGNKKKVRVGTANAIKMAYELLRDTLPPMDTPRQRGLVSKAKARAAKNKWLPPASWDDDTIDNPLQLPETPQIIRNCQCKTVKHIHGTMDAYLTDKCRCLPCKEANRVYSNRNRRLKAYGRATNHMVDAKPAQKHIKSLMRRGWSVNLIAKNAGVGTSTVSRLLYGQPAKNLKAPKTVLGSTSDRILSFVPVEGRKRYDGTVLEVVDSIGTQRRVQALIACGYTMTFLANEMGVSKQTIHLWMKNDKVSVTNAEAFKTIYDRLWDVEPPRSTAAEKKAYTTAKKMALENEWPPPMAWDDDEIDDPKAKAVA